MKKFIIMIGILLVVVLTIVSCTETPNSTPQETTKASSAESTSRAELTSSAESTSEAKVEQPETTYYFQTVENFKEVPSGYSFSPYSFRHTISVDEERDDAKFFVEATAAFPETVTINGVTYELDESNWVHEGHEVQIPVKNVVPVRESNVLKPSVYFDVIHGNLTSIVNFRFHQSTAEELEKTHEERAVLAIERYLPFVNLNEYELQQSSFQKNPNETNGSVSYVKKIGGYVTNTVVRVNFWNDEINMIRFFYPYEYEDLDMSLLNFDKAEHEKVMASLLEYISNGRKIEETIRRSERLIRTSDGRYAIEYENKIIVYSDSGMELSDISTARFYLE